MKTRCVQLLTPALLLLLLVGAAASSAEEAGEAPVDLEALRSERKAKAIRYGVRQRISKRHNAAQEARLEGDYQTARELLSRLEGKKLNPYERALTYQLLGFVAYEAEEFPAAIDYFRKAVDQQALSVETENKLRFYIAQLYAIVENWPEVVATLEEWLRYQESPDPLGYYLLGVAHYRLEQFDEALVATQKAVDAVPEPKEGWLQLLSAIHLQREDYRAAQPVLERLVSSFPKKTYWVQLSMIYGALEEYRESLGVQQIAYLQGLLVEDRELRRLARSLLYHSLPHDAARVLEKGLEEGRIEADVESLELLGNSWIAAREYGRAVEPLGRAASLSEDGALFVRLSQVHMQREQWRDAAELLEKALAKGGLEDPGNVQLLLGISYYYDKKTERARSSFQRASRGASTRNEADAWLMHIERELGQAEQNGRAKTPLVLHPIDAGDVVPGSDGSAVRMNSGSSSSAGV
jgi:tetratricopeptide (TPR) repeat protein